MLLVRNRVWNVYLIFKIIFLESFSNDQNRNYGYFINTNYESFATNKDLCSSD